MPRYIYTAKTQPYETINGNIQAESEQEAVNKLNQMGYFPISVKPESFPWNQKGVLRFWKISSKDVVFFTRQLTSLIESGINIINSLKIAANQTTNKYLKSILNDIIAKIKDGMPLSESLSQYPNLFSGLYISMIHSGEVGGKLEDALSNLSDFLEKDDEFKNSIRSALTYPFFILTVSALTVIILLGFVIPRFVNMFADMGQALPLPTKILIGLSSGLRSYWCLILLIGITFIFSLRRLYRQPQGKLSLDKIKLKFPVWGEVILKTEISRLMRTLSLLLSSGIPIVYSIETAKSVLENQVLKLEVEKFKANISSGSSFSHCLNGSSLFPAFVTNIIAIGEETGSLEKSLLRIANKYETEAQRSLKTFTQFLEPSIILIMGLVVGFIVLSMLLPIFQINLIVK